jgi:hypothetical protein
MKKVAIPSLLAIAILSFTLTACGGSTYGSGENMLEKMAIFSLISLTFFSIFVVSFGGSRQKNNRSQGKVDFIQHGSTYPLSTTDLTSYPVYVWDYRSSFHKIVFHTDGVLLKSSSVSENGLDPTVTAVGTWALTSDGKVQVTFNSAGTTKIYTRISMNTSTVLMKPDFGLVEAWYFGSGSLANIQISIFGYSASVPATMKFTNTLVSGRTFYWATYPCILVTTSGEVVVNHETTYGMITFNEDGILTKSIDNKISSTPNYTPSISGIWSVDDKSGVLTMTVSGFTTAASILNQESENSEWLVSTTVENRLWFSDPTNAAEKLATYISEGCKLIPGF